MSNAGPGPASSTVPRQVSQVRNVLTRNFSDLIDMRDFQNKQPHEWEPAFLSRALAALVVRNVIDCDLREAAMAVIDVRDDFGIDAVAISETSQHVWLIQSKWSDTGRASFNTEAAHKFVPEYGCSVVQAAVALACAHPNPKLALRAKQNVDTLWEQGPDGAYPMFFREQPGAHQIWGSGRLQHAIGTNCIRSANSSRDAPPTSPTEAADDDDLVTLCRARHRMTRGTRRTAGLTRSARTVSFSL